MAANWTMGLDLGGTGVRLAGRRGGLLFAQSGLVALRKGQKDYVALGDEARQLRGREPMGIGVYRAVEAGRVVSEAAVEAWVSALLEKAQEAGIGRGQVLLAGGALCREADLQAVREAVLKAGGSGMAVLEADFAAALGAWLPKREKDAGPVQVDVMEESGCMVVDIGGYGAFASLMVGGQVVRRESLPYGTMEVIAQLRGLLRAEYALAAGWNTVESLFHVLSTVEADRDMPPMAVRGLGLSTRLPATAQVRLSTVRELLVPFAQQVGQMALSALAHAPEELCADILERGILLTGGGARIPQIPKAVEEKTGIRCRVSDKPEEAAIRGVQRVLDAPAHFASLPLMAETAS